MTPSARPTATSWFVSTACCRPAAGESGFVATLNVGNPLGLTVHEFTLRGHFGDPRPERLPSEDDGAYQHRLDEWDKSLTPFQHLFLDDLRPGEWTRVELPIRAARLSDIRILRFAMIIDRAFLENQSGTGELAVLNGLKEGTTIAKTDYGAFLINSIGTETTTTGVKLKLAVGNPFILTLNQVRLKGEFGPAPPQRQEGETLPTFAARMETWQSGLKPFEDVIKSAILPGRWTDTSIEMPTQVLNELGYIRFSFIPESAYLPVPQGSEGPRR